MSHSGDCGVGAINELDSRLKRERARRLEVRREASSAKLKDEVPGQEQLGQECSLVVRNVAKEAKNAPDTIPMILKRSQSYEQLRSHRLC